MLTSTNLPVTMLMDLPSELWTEIKPHAGWSAMLNLSMTSEAGQTHWKRLIETPAADFSSFQLFNLVMTERYQTKVESNLDPLTNQVKVLTTAGTRYAGPPISEIEFPYHQSWLFQVFNRMFAGVVTFSTNLNDPIEKITYIWQHCAITYVKKDGSTLEKIPFGKMMYGLDFFGSQFLVLATTKSLFFLDRKTRKIIKEYPLFSQVHAIKVDYAKNEIIIAEKLTLTTLSFSDKFKSQKSLLPLSDKNRSTNRKILHTVVDIFKNFFSRSTLNLVTTAFTFTVKYMKWPTAVLVLLREMREVPEFRDRIYALMIDLIVLGILTTTTITFFSIAVAAGAIIGTGISLTCSGSLNAIYQ